MAKLAKKEKKEGENDLNKQSFVIQKGVSRSGRAIKPKTLFGEPLIEIASTKSNKSKEKLESLKSVAKVVKKPKTKVSEKKTPKKVSPKKSQNSAPKFTTVDISKIIGTKNDVVSPKTVVSPKKPAEKTCHHVKSPSEWTYEERQKEINSLRAQLKKLEALQEAERKARTTTNHVEEKKKVVEKKIVVKKTSPKPLPTKVVASTSDGRPSRVIKPTWKAIEGVE